MSDGWNQLEQEGIGIADYHELLEVERREAAKPRRCEGCGKRRVLGTHIESTGYELDGVLYEQECSMELCRECREGRNDG